MMDQAFVSKYQNDFAVARMAAEAAFANMANTFRSRISIVNLGFDVSFHQIFFTDEIAPNNWSTGGSDSWQNNLRNFWSGTARSCIKRDGVILFTGQNVGYDGVTNNNLHRVCEIGTPNNKSINMIVKAGSEALMAQRIAHEIMHTFGFGHRDGSGTQSCAAACNLTNTPFMCPAGGEILLSTTCEGYCLAAQVFCTDKAPCLTEQSIFYEDDFVCPPSPGAIAYNCTFDNPNPVAGCATGADIVTVTVTFFNNNLALDRNFRVIMSANNSTYMEFLPDPSSPFNCIKTLPSGSKEFRITNPISTNCENEVAFALAEGEIKTFNFKLKYLGGAPLGALSFKIYTGNDPAFDYKNFAIYPFVQITNGVFSDLYFNISWPQYNPLLITGKLTMNPSSSPLWGSNVYSFANNKKLVFAPGAELEIAPNSTIEMPHIQIEGCSTMWKGVTVRQGSALEMSMMTSVKDAQYAVNVQKGGTADVQSCKFEDNNYAIRTAPEGAGNHNITLLGNTFVTSEAGLKTNYSGQSPAPGTKGFAGIYVKDFTAGLGIDKDTLFGLANNFSNLHHGILAENTNVTVRDAIFTDIVKETRPSGYPGPFFTGTAIHLTKGSANIKGSYTGIASDPVVMDHCHTGINVLGGSIEVGGCEMGNITNGIIAGGGANKAYSVYSMVRKELGVVMRRFCQDYRGF